MAANGWSKTWTFFENDWHEGNVPIMGPRTHAAWLASMVFDGARAFEGVTPDLDLHCKRDQQLRTEALPQADRGGGDVDGPRRRRPEAFRQGRRALYPPDVLGRAGWAGCRRIA